MTVAILHLGRSRSMGEAHRVRSWELICREAGLEHVSLPLLDLWPSALRRPPAASSLRHVVSGAAVPESMAWRWDGLRRQVEALRPHAVIAVTARVYHPALQTLAATVVLDFVDQLSSSYSDRAAIVRGAPVRARGFQLLAAAHRRFEQHRPTVAVAAGWRDAERLGSGVEWVPIVLEPEPAIAPSPAPDSDVLFFGNLAYPPNVAGVRNLARLWGRFPGRGPTVTIAGASPTPEVVAIVKQMGWRLEANFPALRALCSRSKIAVVPLAHAAGIQIKVLQAAMLGLPQVLTAEAASGLDPLFPCARAQSDDEVVAEVSRLLDHSAEASALGEAARGHMLGLYSPAAWTDWAHARLQS